MCDAARACEWSRRCLVEAKSVAFAVARCQRRLLWCVLWPQCCCSVASVLTHTTMDCGAPQGFGEACRLAKEEMERDEKWVSFLADRMVKGIQSQLDHVILNGDAEHRYAYHRASDHHPTLCRCLLTTLAPCSASYPGNVNLSFAYVEVSVVHRSALSRVRT